jgi:cell division septation protein DedD
MSTLVVALACALPPGVEAQTSSLGDIARKEAARRKSTPAPAKAYTNADLPETAMKAPATQAPAQSTAPAPSAAEPAPAAPKPEAEQRDEAWWRTKMAQLREELRRNEVFQQALESRINALTADGLRRDDPYQRAKLGEDRAKAAAEMARVTGEIATGRQAITDLEEEARKQAVPPGWLR